MRADRTNRALTASARRCATVFAALLVAAGTAAAAGLRAAPETLHVTPEEGAAVRLEFALEDPAGQPVTGVAFLGEASFGRVSEVEEHAPGRYRAEYRAPAADAPGVALVVLTPQDRSDVGVLFRRIPVHVHTVLAARTEPGSTVSCTIGSRTFGPITAHRTGRWSLDLELEPGDREAEVRLQDRAGNVRRRDLALPRRKHDALLVSLDRHRLATDGTQQARVFAFAFDEDGRPIERAEISAKASDGEVGSFVDNGDGVHTATYLPPADGSERVARLDFRLRSGGATHEDVERVSLVRGAPARLVLAAEPTTLIAGADALVELTAVVQDAAGHLLRDQPVRFATDRGTLAEPVRRRDGRVTTTLTPPDRVESGSIQVTALLVQGVPERRPSRIEVAVDPAEVPTSWRAYSLVTATVTDEDGLAVAGEVLLFQLAGGEGTVTPVAVTNAEGQAFADFSASPLEEAVAVEVVATSVAGLRGSVAIEKRDEGSFVTVERPAVAAQGGRPQSTVVLGDGERVLRDSVVIALQPGPAAVLTARAEPDVLPADGRSASRIVMQLTDAAGNGIPDAVLALAADRGTLADVSPTGDGEYRATLTAPLGAGSGELTVVVQHADSGLSAEVPVQLTAGPVARLLLASDRDRLPADDLSEARLVAVAYDATDVRVPGASVELALSGVTARLESPVITDDAGEAEAVLTAGLEPGQLAITARADEGEDSVALTLLPLGPVALVARAEPERIPADGITRSEITVELEDALGQPMAGEMVEFTQAGPGRLTHREARSDTQGVARTWLSGTDPGTARIRARSRSVPSLSEDVEVVLEAAELVVDFTVEGAACDGEVTLVALVPEAVLLEWDWTGDGIADATGERVSAPLPAGRHEVTLTAADADGVSAARTESIVVGALPVAVASAAPDVVASGGTVVLDGSGSSAADGSPVTHEWDWSEEEGPEAVGPTAQWRMPDGGHVAVLTVTDASGCRASTEVSAIFGEVPDLGVAVSAVGDPSQVEIGELVEYRVDWANRGEHQGTQVRVESQLDDLLEIAQLPAGAVVLGPGRLRFDLGTLAPGAAGFFLVQARVASDLPATTAVLSHAVTIASLEPDADPSDNADSALVLAFEDVDVSVSLAPSSPAGLQPGQRLDLVATVTVLGTIDLDGVTLGLGWDPALLGGFAADRPATSTAGLAEIALGPVAGGGSIDVALSWTVPPTLPVAVQQALVSASVTHGSRDPDPSNDADSVAVDLTARPDLSLSIVASPERSPLEPGDTVRYELLWANAGTTVASGVTVECRFTADLVARLVENPDGGILQGDVLRFSLGAVEPGRQEQLSFRIELPTSVPLATDRIRNEAFIDSVEAALDPQADNQATSVLPVAAPPDVWVSLSAPSSGRAGEPVGWTITAGNAGTRPATGVWVEHRIDGAALDHETSSRTVDVTTDAGGLVLRTEIGRLDPGRTVTWTHAARVATPQAAVSPTVTSVAEVGLDEPDDSDPANNRTAPTSFPVEALPDLGVTLALSDPAPQPGGAVAASVTVSSQGDAPSPGGRVTLEGPSDVLELSAPVEVVVPALAVGDAVTLPEVVVSVKAVQPATTNPATLTARVTGDAGDLDPTNDQDAVDLAVVARPDLVVTATAVPGPLAPGDSAWVDVEWTNAGTTAATDVLVSLEPIDVGLFGEPSPATVVVPVLAVGDAGSQRFELAVFPTLPQRTLTASLRAEGSATEADADPSNDAAAVSIDLEGSVDLAVDALELRTFPDPPEPGATVEYVLRVENLGTAPSTGGELRFDRDPSLLTPSTALPPGASDSGGRIRWPLPTLAPAQTYQRSLRFSLPEALAEETTVVDATTAASDPFDGVPANDAADASFTVGARVDLGVVLALEPTSQPLWAGGTVRAVAHVSNAGTKDARDVELVLELPAPLVQQVLSTSAGARSGPSWVRWTIPEVLAGETNLVRETTFRLSAALPSTSTAVEVRATVSADPVTNPEDPANLADNSDTQSVVSGAAADLCVRLEALPDPDPPAVGGRLGYELSVENAGTTAAGPVTLVLEIDDGFLIVDDAGGGAAGPGTLTWVEPSIAVGQVVTRTVEAHAPGSFPGLWYGVLARGEATASQDDGTGCSTRTPTVETLFSTISDLRVEKKLLATSESPPRRGTRYDYRIIVENVGTAASPGAVVTDLYPSQLLVADPGGGVDDGSSLRWTLPGPIARGDTFVIDYSLEVEPMLAAGLHVLRNEAVVENDGVDAFPSNDRFVHETSLLLDVDLGVSLIGVPNPAPPVPGSTIDYVATVENHGSETALGATLEIDLGPLAELIGPSPGVGTAPILVSLGDVPSGDVRVIPFSARSAEALPAELNLITVTATVSSLDGDGHPADNVDSVSHGVRARTDLRAELTVVDRDGAPLEAGDLLDYQLRVTNRGARIATGTTVRVDFDPTRQLVVDAGELVPGGGGVLDAAIPGGVAVTDPPLVLAFTLQVAGELPSTLNLVEACGEVASDVVDAFPADDRDCVALTAVACPDLQVELSLSAPTTPASPGQAIEATARVTNAGSTAATGVVLTIERDALLTAGLVTSTPPGTDDGSVITIPLGDLAVGASATANAQVALAGTMPTVDGVLTAGACASAVEQACDPDGVCADAALSIRAPIDVWIELTVTPGGVLQPGAQLSHDVAFGNDGASPARGVVVTVELPDDVDVLDAGGGSLVGRTIEFRGTPTLLPGDADSRTVLLRVRSALETETTTLRQTARIAHDRPDAEADPSDDVSVVDREVRAWADLVVSLERTSSPPVPDGVVSYRATWQNAGTTVARTATLTVSDDPDLLLVTGQPPAAFGRTFDLGDVPVGGSGAQSLQYRVKRVLPAPNNQLTTTVAVASTTTERTPGDNVDSVTDAVLAQANLGVALDVTPAETAGPCDPLSATISWTNAGNTAAVGVQVVFTFDPALVSVTDAGGGALDAAAGRIAWAPPSVAVGAGGSATVRMEVACVLPEPSNAIALEAEVSSGTPEADPRDDRASASLAVEACADLSVSLAPVSASSSPLGPAGTVRYRLSVENLGNTRATAVNASLDWSDAAFVSEVVDAGGGTVAGQGSLSWALGTVAVGDAPVVRDVELRAAETFPTDENLLSVDAAASALECDLEPASNAAATTTPILAPPDLVLSATLTNVTTGSFPAVSQDGLRYDYLVTNVGASPAEDVVLRSEYDAAVLQWSGGGVPLPLGTVTHRRGAASPLAPGGTWAPSTTFTVRDLPPPPTSVTLDRTALVEESAFGLARDANPADNEAGTSLVACFEDAVIVQPYSGTVCRGSSVTLRAEVSDPAASTFAWAADFGTFDDPTAQVVVYHAPETAGSYEVRLQVTTGASHCPSSAVHVVVVDPSCAACGCQSAKMNLQYDGLIERVDLPGNRTAEQGENVAFRVRVKETANSRSGLLLGGAGNSVMTFGPGGGPTYVAYLPHDIRIECQTGGVLEFAAADVPADMPLGDYTAAFLFKVEDDCGDLDTRPTETGGDRVRIVEATQAAPDPGVVFTDWGPVRRQP